LSKLSHSNTETMLEIERRNREAERRGEPDEPRDMPPLNPEAEKAAADRLAKSLAPIFRKGRL